MAKINKEVHTVVRDSHPLVEASVTEEPINKGANNFSKMLILSIYARNRADSVQPISLVDKELNVRWVHVCLHPSRFHSLIHCSQLLGAVRF